ncbi:hypothetical protein ACXJJ3_08840 [Kribbella sp. WER1]
MSRSRAVATCRFCADPIIYRHWNGHRAWTHRATGNAHCEAYSTVAAPRESDKFTNGEEP